MDPRQGRTVLVLGGGIGGIVAANRLRRRLAREDRVVLVEREREHVFQPSLLWVLTGARSPDAIQRPLERLNRRRIEVVTGEIEAIDASSVGTYAPGPKDMPVSERWPATGVARVDTLYDIWPPGGGSLRRVSRSDELQSLLGAHERQGLPLTPPSCAASRSTSRSGWTSSSRPSSRS